MFIFVLRQLRPGGPQRQYGQRWFPGRKSAQLVEVNRILEKPLRAACVQKAGSYINPMARDTLVDCIRYAPTEAAFVADLSVREVQKAFDEGWFDLEGPPPAANRTRRTLGIAELLHLRVIKDTCRYVVLQSETKKELHKQLLERLSMSSSFRNSVGIANVQHIQNGSDRFAILFRSMTHLLNDPIRVSQISIDTSVAWQDMIGRLADTTAARFAVVSDPDIRGGEPVVRGTRIPVHLLRSMVEQGATNEELLSDYPALDTERLRLSLLYAQNHPRPGRPKKRPWQNAALHQ
jgi:uncharacterized protein (DUF433 family)